LQRKLKHKIGRKFFLVSLDCLIQYFGVHTIDPREVGIHYNPESVGQSDEESYILLKLFLFVHSYRVVLQENAQKVTFLKFLWDARVTLCKY
jgi:hypothetical protein